MEQKFKIGDYVLLLRGKKLFEKGNKSYYKSKYQIIGKEDNTYIIQKGNVERKAQAY